MDMHVWFFVFLMIHCLHADDCNGMPRQIVNSSDGLVSLLNGGALNNVCIELNCDQIISTNITLVKESNIVIIGNGDSCQCVENVGISFEDSTNIAFKHISFNGCGRAFNSTIPAPTNGRMRYIYAAFYFKQTVDITFTDVTLNGSKGYAVVMYDCGGVNFLRTIIIKNFVVPNVTLSETMKGYASGGGLYVEHTYGGLSKFTHNKSYIITSCVFESNHGEVRDRSDDDRKVYRRGVPFGRGAGISFFLLGTAYNNSLHILNTNISDNKGLFGAGLYVELSKNSWKNTITVEGGLISGNSATLSGGGFFAYTGCQEEFKHNTVVVKGVRFLHNIAQIGGAFSVYSLIDADFLFRKVHYELFVRNCSFMRNHALLGAAVFLEAVSVSFADNHVIRSNMDNINQQDFDHQKLAAFYSYHSNVLLTGDHIFRRNFGTAVILDFSRLHVVGTITFRSNVGLNGGAMAFYQRSSINITDVTALTFKDNNATKGGAIYLNAPGVPLELWNTPKLLVYDCFIQGHEHFVGRVAFISNLAREGNAIFGTTLQHCQNKSGIERPDVIRNWKHFDFSKNNELPIMTDPIRILTDDDYNNTSQWRSLYPGKWFTPHIKLLDEQNNPVSDVVLIKIESPSNKVLLKNGLIAHVVITERVGLIIIAKFNKTNFYEKFSVTLTSPRQKAPPKVIPELQFTHCPFGYAFKKNPGECLCGTNQAKGIVQCHDEHVYLEHNMWSKYDQTGVKRGDVKVVPCPDGYCSKNCTSKINSGGLSCLYKPHNQCAENRNQISLLCSLCETNHSVSFGSEKCMKCSGAHKYGVMVLAYVVIAGVIVFYFLLINMDVYYNYLNSVLYFYQVAYLVRTPTQNYDDGMEMISHMLNFNGFYFDLDVCLVEGLTNLTKMFVKVLYLDFVFVVVLLLVLCGRLCGRYFKIFTKRKFFNALVLIMMYVYSNITKVVLFLFNTVHLDDEKSGRLFVFAKLTAETSNSLYCLTLAFAIFHFVFIVFLFPAMLIFPEFFLAIPSICSNAYEKFCGNHEFNESQSCGCCLGVSVNVYKPLLDNFNRCYKGDKISQKFSGYYFFWRLIFLIAYVAYPLPEEQGQLTIFACLSVLSLMIFAAVRPYRSNIGRFKWLSVNMLDLLVLSNLTAISILSNGKRKLYSSNSWNHGLAVVINVLMWLPCVVPCLCFLVFLVDSIKKTLARTKRKLDRNNAAMMHDDVS